MSRNGTKNIQDAYPLSPLQEGLLFHTLADPEAGLYTGQFTCRLSRVNVAAFEQAWERAIERHAALRTAFIWKKSNSPLQAVARRVSLPLRKYDWRALTSAQQQEQFESYLEADRLESFNLNRPPLIRLGLFRVGDDSYRFLWNHHHLVLDGWSVAILLKEVFTIYEALWRGGPIQLAQPRPYRDYIAWLQQQDASAAASYWQEYLNGFTAPTPLPASGPTSLLRPSAAVSGKQLRQLSTELTAALQQQARRNRLTMNTLVQGAWAILLSRYGGAGEVVFGATVSGRPAEIAGVEEIVGLFINTLPVRVRVNGREGVLEWLHNLQEQQVQQRQYEYSSLVEVQGWSEVPRGTRLFESIVVFENYPLDTSLQANHESIEITDVDHASASDLPLMVTAFLHPDLALRVEYDSDRFDEAGMARLLSHFEMVLAGISTANSETRLRDLSLLPASEREQQLREWNPTPSSLPAADSIVELFEAQVERTPEALALSFGEQRLSYRELNERANQLGHYFASLGLGPEDFVALLFERSIEMVIGLLAVLKAGAAFLPLDPDYPEARLDHLMSDSEARWLLTNATLAGRIASTGSRRLIVDELKGQVGACRKDNPPRHAPGENAAYLIYTSGSTGQPKGVVISHQNLVSYVTGAGNALQLRSSDRFLQFAALGFDVLVEELFPTWMAGASVVLVSEVPLLAGDKGLSAVISREGITAVELPTAYWHSWVGQLRDSGERVPDQLRMVIIGGERARVELVREWREKTAAELVHVYGVTEATVTTTISRVAASEFAGELPIGRPINYSRVYVLDEQMEPVPLGAKGELYIGGEVVGRGYWRRAAQTAERFMPDNVSGESGKRLYRTGDVVRYVGTQGELEFVGRIDEQVKVRGYRVEPGEVEAVLSSHERVREAVVITRKDNEGHDYLTAYVVATADFVPNGIIAGAALRGRPSANSPVDVEQRQSATSSITPEELRSYLTQHLPDYMVPSAIMMLDRLPLNPHGKVAVDQLPTPATTEDDEDDEAPPRGAVEEVLAAIWSEVLGVERLGRGANFFRLGGHSLQAMQVVARVREAFNIDLPLRRFLDAPTLVDLALNIEEALHDEERLQLPPLERVSRDQRLPLSFAQQRLWFLHQLNPLSPAYNMRHAVRLLGQLHVNTLERALGEIVKRHEILRTTFAATEGEPVQVIAESLPVYLRSLDFSHLSETEREEETHRFTVDEVRRPFTLTEGPLLRPFLIRIREDEHVLLLVLHHIISDGWSTAILAEELGIFYEAMVQHEQPRLPELPVQYADYAYWQRNCLQGATLNSLFSYWRDHLSGELAVLDLPTDKPRTSVQSLRGERRNKVLPRSLLESLKSLSNRESVTLFMTLLAAFETLLYRYTGQEDLFVGTPIANRNHVATERLIGFFINTLVLRTRLSGRTGFRELLRHVREVTLGAYTHQELPFEKLVEEIQPHRNLGRMPLFQVMFMLQNVPMPHFEHAGVRLSPMEVYSGATEFDLVLNTMETEEGLLASITYNSDLFDATTIERMLNHYEVLLQGIVAEPNQSLALLPIMTQAERYQLLEEWNDSSDYTQDQAIHELFAAQVERQPDAPALSFGGQQISYDALNQAANQLARGLLQTGVAQGTPIAVMLDSGPLQIVALLGILKTGCHFVCLDPEYPESRLKLILSEVSPSCLISEPAILDRQSSLMEQLASCRIVAIGQQMQGERLRLVNCIDGSRWFETCPSSNPQCEVSPADLAYIVFTSGSTGQPKGIMQTHESFCQFIEWQSREFEIHTPRRIPQWAAITYDASYAEIFATLCFGGTLCLASSDVKADPRAVVEWARRERLSLLQFVPSFCAQVLQVLEEENPAQHPLPDLEFMLLAGEVLPVELTQRWYALFPGSPPALFNLYGPTESVLATYHPVSEADTRRHLIPVGRAIPGRQILVLDQQKQLCPIGVKGEIYIRSKYLTTGYFQNPKETQEVFGQNPLHKEYFDRVYRTHDLGRWLPGGNLEFSGRMDHQVKVRGMRIELEEIEAVLLKHALVKHCVVAVAHEELAQRLVAWVVTSENVSPPELRGFMKEWLPDHMVPSAFIFLSELPLLPNGKIDRHALSLSGTELAVAGAAEYVAPQTPLEISLAQSWMDLLHLERVGIHDDFFELGGHSLLATQAVNKIRQLCGVELPLRSFFETPTIAGLAAKLEPLISPRVTDEQRLAQVMEKVKHLSDEEVDEFLRAHANIFAH
nr:condensation domain-containing protein [uncultured bacterium]